MKRKVAKKTHKKAHKKTHRKVAKKTTKKASSPTIAKLRKEYGIVKRAYKEIGRKLGRATGVTR